LKNKEITDVRIFNGKKVKLGDMTKTIYINQNIAILQELHYILHNQVVIPISAAVSLFDYFGTWMHTKRYDYL